MSETNRRLVVGVTEGPGAALGVRLLELLRDAEVETHLVVSPAAERSMFERTGREPAELRGLAGHTYAIDNMAARISSGSFLTDGMIVAPCSLGSLAAIATGLASDLVLRAADVTIKEGRKLLLLLGEAPRNRSHMECMRRLSVVRTVVIPPVGAFSPHGADHEDVGRIARAVLDQFAIPQPEGEAARAGS
jgi:flavin prenyltransferase